MAGKDAAIDITPEASNSLTDAYASGWVSDWVDVNLATHLRFLLTIVKDGATTIELKIEVDEEGGTTGYACDRIGTDGAIDLDEIVYTASELAASDTRAIQFSCADVGRVRLRAKRTGGDSGTTLDVKVTKGTMR